MPEDVAIPQNTPFEESLNQSNFGKFGRGLDGLASTQNVAKTTAEMTSDELQNVLLERGRAIDAKAKAPSPFLPSTVNASQIDTSGRFDKQLLGQDNEDLYGQMQSNWDKAANGVLKTIKLATNTFLQGTLGSIYGLGQVVAGNGLNSFYNNDFSQAIQKWNDSAENVLPNYYTAHERDAKWYEPANLFTANFLFDKLIKNAGFSIGAIAAGAVTGAAIKSLTSLMPIFGAGEEAAQTVKSLEQAVSSVPAESRWKVFQGLVRNANTNNLGKVANFLGEGANSPTAQRFIVSSLGAATEGGIEALQGLNEWRNQKISEYTQKYGVAPQGEELAKIDNMSSSLGNARFGLNMALLTATNYIQLPRILGSSYKVSRGLANTEAAALGETAIKTGKYSWLSSTGAPNNFLGKLAYRAKGIGGVLFSPSEAFEETSQYAIQKGVENYYNKAYGGIGANWVDEIATGYKQALSDKDGLESLLLGGLSGGLQQGIGTAIDEKRLPFISKPKSVQASQTLSAALNASKLSLSSDKWLSDMADVSARGINLMHEGEGYIRQGDVLEAKDNEHDQMHNYLAVRIKHGRYDLVKSDIAAIKNEAATPQGFEALKQQGIVNEADTQATFTTRIDNFQKHADNINALYQSLALKYGGLTDKAGQKLYNEKVVDKMVYAGSKVADYDDRIHELSQGLISNGIPIQQVVAKIIQNGAASDVEVREAAEAINKMQIKSDGTSITSDERDDMKGALRDVVEMSLRRRAYLKEYDDIKQNPASYGKPTEFARKETTPITAADVVQNVDLGREYSLTAPIHREGNSIFLAPKMTPLNDTVTGEVETLMPDGTTKQFIKAEDLGKYGLTTTPNDSKDVEAAFTKAVEDVMNTPKFEPLKEAYNASVKDAPSLQTFINTQNNVELTDAIMSKMAPKMQDIQKQREEQIKKEILARKNKKLIDAILAAMNAAGDGTNNEIIVADDDSLGFKKDIEFISRTGTEQRYEDENIKFNNVHRRHQEFLLGFSVPKIRERMAKLNVKIIAVTAKTEEGLGLKGIIDKGYEDTSIRYVYIAQEGDNGDWNFVDKNGTFLNKVGQSTDLEQVIFTNAPEEDLSYGSEGKRTPSYVNKSNLSDEQIQHQLDAWKTQRGLFMSIPSAQDALESKIDFSISRGIPNVAEVTTENNLLSIGLVEESDLAYPLIGVPTIGNSVIKDSELEVNMPLGKPVYNYRGNLFFVNNRKFTPKEAKNVLSLLQMALSGQEEDRILPFIKDVVFFTNNTPTESTSRNQIWFDKELTMHTWNQTFTLEQVMNADPAVLAALEATYHNVNNRTLNEFAKNPQNSPFNELSVENGKLVTTKWPSYQHYLLSPRKGGETAPVTTNIVQPLTDEELPIIQKYPILKIGNLQASVEAIVEDEPEVTEDRVFKSKGLGEITTPSERAHQNIASFEVSNINPTTFKVSGVYHTPKGGAIEVTVAAVLKDGKFTLGFATGLAEINKLSVAEQGSIRDAIIERLKGEKPAEAKKPGGISGFGTSTSGFEDAAKRLTTKPFLSVGNKDVELKEVARMLPNLNVVMLSNLIENSGGLKAWGYALPHFAYVWDQAPFGTLYHEAFEQVYNWVLSLEDQANLYNEFIQRPGTFTTYNGTSRKYSDASEFEAKEELADEFAEFKASGKIIKPTAKKSSFFRALLDFLRTLFTNPSAFWNKTGEVAKVFNKINRERYKNAPVVNDVNAEPQYRQVKNMAESLVQDTIAGMTSELFMKKWESDLSLIQELETNPEASTRTLFDQLKAGLENYFTGRDPKTSLYAYFNDLVQADRSKEQEYVDLYNDINANWEKVKVQWGPFMEDLKSFLRIFNVAFVTNDEGEIALAEDLSDINEVSAPQDYASEDRLFINAKNSASQVVKLFFATIADSKFVFNITKDNITGNLKRIFAGNKLNREANQMRLSNLAPYAKLFNYTLHNAANINGIYNIYDALKAQSEKRDIKINANLDVLLKRLKFEEGFDKLDLSSMKLLLKVENTLSKQKPEFFIQSVNEAGEVFELSSNVSDRASQLKQEWWEDMKGSKYVKKSGNELRFREGVVPKNGDNFVFLDNIGITFTQEQFDKLSPDAKNRFRLTLTALKASVQEYTTKKIPAILALNSTGFEGRLTQLAKIFVEGVEGDTTESQHNNVENKPTSNFILNNYVSFILNDLNNVTSLQDFINLNPQYKDLYMGSSYWLNNVLFQEGVRTDNSMSVAILEGRVGSSRNATASMTYGERVLNEVNNNINGKYHILSADSKTEWGIRVQNVMSRNFFRGQRSEQVQEYIDKMFNSLVNEIRLAQDFQNREHITSLTKLEGDREVGRSLRFFKTMLPQIIVDKINDKIDSGEGFSLQQSENLKTLVTPEIIKYIQGRADTTINNLISSEIIKSQRGGRYRIYGIDSNFLRGEFGKKKRNQLFDEATLKDIFFYREANYIFANMEMHKLLFNDPAQYKDELKRVKSFMSGREFTHVSTENNKSLNKALDEKLNRQGETPILPTDFGYRVHSNTFEALTVRDVSVHSTPEIVKAFKDYADVDVADAQSWIHPLVYRELLYKAGGRFTNAQDALHNWMMAYQRQAYLKKGRIKDDEYSAALQDADKEILKSPIPNATMDVLKPIISGVRNYEDNTPIAEQYLYKTSTAPLYFYFVEGRPMEDILWKMEQEGVHFLAMQSAHKVGQEAINTVDMFDKWDFDVKSTVPIDFKYTGIQVDTSGKKESQTQGSQLTKLGIQNLMADGKAIKPEFADLVKKHNDILANLAIKRSDKIFKRLGFKKGEFGYEYKDKKRVADFILNELTRRELPYNIGEGIGTDADGEFNTPLEANVNYKKIKEILWSTIENNLTRPKTSGKPLIMLSALGWANIKPETLNGKEVLTSSSLKFYRTEDGKTQACQIAIPFRFGDILERIERSQGKKFSSQKEGYAAVLTHLNKTEEGKKLLRGIGFRIPTQGLNSVDYFEIAEFLPPQMGDVVVFPAEITKKAGSDFDIDKMNMYLKNYTIGRDGFPVLTKFENIDTADEQALRDYYEIHYLDKYKKAKAKQAASALLSGIFGAPTDDDYIPSIDEYLEDSKGKSAYEVNAVEALENEYYSTLEDILSLPYNFERMIKPNDASQLKRISEEIQVLNGTSEPEVSTNYTQLIDSSYMSNKRQVFVSMKNAVGIAAVSNTNLSINQMAGYVIHAPVAMTYKNFKVRFEHNSNSARGTMTSVGGISLGEVKNGFGDFLSDLNSQVIDGTVDATKSTWLAKMITDESVLNVLLFMYKGGIDPRAAGFYLNQPAIQDFLKEKGIIKNISGINTSIKPKFAPAIQRTINQRYKAGGGKDAMRKMRAQKPDEYTLDEMKDMIGKGLDKLNRKQKLLQVQMLDDFMVYDSMAWDLFTSIQGYNWDTSRFTSPEAVDRKKLQWQKASIQKNTSSVESLLDASHIGVLKDKILDLNGALSHLLNTQQGDVKRTLNEVAVVLNTMRLKRDDFIKYLQKAEGSLIDYVSQTQADFNGVQINELSRYFFQGQQNIAKWVAALKTVLPLNKFLNNVEAVIDPTGQLSHLRIVEQDYDAYTSNVWTASLREIRDSGEPVTLTVTQADGTTTKVTKTAHDIYNYMLISQILQNGVSRNRSSFLHLMPNEDYSKLISPHLRSIQNEEEWLQSDQFFRNNWTDNVLVPEAQKMNISFDQEGTPLYTVANYIGSAVFYATLKDQGYKADVITLPVFGWKNKPYVKSTVIARDERGVIIDSHSRLYKRVDSLDEDGNRSPISAKLTYTRVLSESEAITETGEFVVYKQVNKLGDDNLKEYYGNGQIHSILSTNETVDEIPDGSIIGALIDAGYATKDEFLTDIINDSDFDGDNEDEDEDDALEFEDIPTPPTAPSGVAGLLEAPTKELPASSEAETAPIAPSVGEEFRQGGRIRVEYPETIEGIPSEKLVEFQKLELAQKSITDKSENNDQYGDVVYEYLQDYKDDIDIEAAKWLNDNPEIAKKLLALYDKDDFYYKEDGDIEDYAGVLLERNEKEVDTAQLSLFSQDALMKKLEDKGIIKRDC